MNSETIYTAKTLPKFSTMMPPTIVNLPRSGRTICAGSFIAQVDDSVDMNTVKNRWTPLYKRPKETTHTVASSNGKSSYIVRELFDGENTTYECSCPGFTFHKHCKHASHIEKIQNSSI